jgi:hypothetical protein
MMNTGPSHHSGAADFDFFIGHWRVAHRRLNARLAGCDEWTEFTGTSVAQKILGGLGNLDDNTIDLPGGAYRAATLRSYDNESGQWSIWWLDGRHPGNLDTPVVGHFEKGGGAFYAEEMFDGRPIRVRFLWTLPDPGTPRWEQAFSVDKGATWEINWIMDFTRASPEA